MSSYKVPAAEVSALSPQGFKVSIPDEKGITLFAFHGKLNKPMVDLRDQTWATDIILPTHGRWVYENSEVLLKVGDILYYWLTVRYNGLDYHAMHQISRFDAPSSAQ
ncbi:LOW QUALITY PROTEIN: gram-negative bacteria-binding protein 3 [Drosophila bipectinata]|uniref:LOW QUALITY PROTEIN: gram-negative bacteria-binding protein 3 n=1 Tax=Drosophila bipectinata TaxID=42026 RepID=UPI001C8A1827|nr:LOW QUALITY PROTEIN: gram-negative bacteria-binding protein 3 [Drosophila bipectinata]